MRPKADVLKGLQLCGSRDDVQPCGKCPYRNKKNCVQELTADAAVRLEAALAKGQKSEG